MSKHASALADSAELDGDRDVLDLLVPLVRPLWQRLVIGIVLVGGLAFLANLWRTGVFMPQPDCCGSGSGQATMAISSSGDAVVVTTYFYNSSPRAIEISSAIATLDGGSVRSIGVIAGQFPASFPTPDINGLPFVVPATSGARIAITFTPDRCVDADADWGSVRLRLDTTGSLPSVGRTYELPDPVFERGRPAPVFGPADVPSMSSTPLATACALLEATR